MILLKKTALSLILALAFFMDASSAAQGGPPSDEGATRLSNPQRSLFTPEHVGAISPPLQACAADAEDSVKAENNSPPHHPDRAPTPYDNISPEEHRQLLRVLAQKEEKIQSLLRALENNNRELERMKRGRNPESPKLQRLTEEERRRRVTAEDKRRRELSEAHAQNAALQKELEEMRAMERELRELMELTPNRPPESRMGRVLEKLGSVLKQHIDLRSAHQKALAELENLKARYADPAFHDGRSQALDAPPPDDERETDI